MAEYVQWNDVATESGGGNGDKVDFLRMKTGNTYRIRPLFYPVKFYKYFHKHEGKMRTAITGNPDTCPVKDRHPELKKASLRYAAYVLDRNDGNKLKICEAPQSVFKPLGNSFEVTGKNPGGGKEGSDWQVKVSGVGLNTSYDVTFIENKPLTQEEKDMIKEKLGGDTKKLKTIFQIGSPEEIEKRLFGGDDEEAQAPSGETESPPESAPASAPAAAPAESGGDDDEWNWAD